MAGQLVETAGIVARLRADTRDFISGLRQSGAEMSGLKKVADSTERGFKALERTADSLGKGIDNLNRRLDSMSRGLRNVGRKAQLGFAGLTAAMGGTVKMATDFELRMTRVGAVSQASAEELERLTAAAREAGRTTIFTAAQAGEALENLALAGFNVDESLNALNGTLGLAAAFQLDLGEATEMVTAQIRAYGLDATEADRVSNVLAATIQNSMASFEKLQFSLRYTAPMFNAVGKSIEDNVAALGLLYNAGFRGQQAGTTLRMAMSRLLKPTAEGQRALAKYGLTFEDVNPEVHDFADIMRKLEPLATDTAAAMELFSVEAAVGMQALLAQGADAYEDLRSKVTDTTTAFDMQEEVGKTLWGQIRVLVSVFEEAALSIGDALLPFVSRLTVGATELVDKFNALDDSTKKLVAKWMAGTAIGLLLVSMVSMLGFALLGLKAAISVIFRPLQMFLKGIAVLGRAVMAVVSTLGLATTGWILLIVAAITGLYMAWRNNWGGIRDVVESVWAAIQPHWESMKAHLEDLLNAVKEGDWKAAWEAIKNIAIDAWNAIKDGAAVVWDWLGPKLKALDELAGGVFTTTWNWLAERIGPVWDFLTEEVFPRLGKFFKSSWEFALQGIEAFRDGRGFEFIQESWMSLKDWDGWGLAADWIKNGFQRFRDFITDPTVINSVSDFISGLAEKLSNIGDFVARLSQNIREQIVKALERLRENMANALAEGSDSEFKEALGNLGRSLWEYIKAGFKLAWELNNLILDLVSLALVSLASVIAGPLIDLGQLIWDGIKAGWEKVADFGSMLLEFLTEHTMNFVDIGVQLGKDLIKGIKTSLSNAKDFVAQAMSNALGDGPMSNLLRNTFGLPAKEAGFMLGGFTGDGAINEIAGVVHKGEYVIPAWMVQRLGPIIAMLERIRNRGYQEGGIVSKGVVQGNFGPLLSKLGIDFDLGQSLQQLMAQLTQFFRHIISILLEIVPDEMIEKVQELSKAWDNLFDEIDEIQEDVEKSLDGIADAHRKAVKDQGKSVNWLQKTLAEFRFWLESNFTLADFAEPLLGGLQELSYELQRTGNAVLDFVGSLADAITVMQTESGGLALDWSQTLLNVAESGLRELGKALGGLLGESAYSEVEKWGARGKSNMPDFDRMTKNFRDWNKNMSQLQKLEKQRNVNVAGGAAAGAGIGFAIGGPIGALVGAGLGALFGKSSSKGIEEQMEELERRLEDTFQKISEFLGTSVGDIANTLTNAFSADTYTGFVKGFAESLESMTKSALIQAFMASEAMAPLMEELSQAITSSVFDGVVTDAEKERIQNAAREIQDVAGEFFRQLQGFSLFGDGQTAQSSGKAGAVLQTLTGPALDSFREMLAPLGRFGEMLELLGSMNMHLASIAEGVSSTDGDTLAGGSVFNIEHLEVHMPENFENVNDFLHELEVAARGRNRGRGK